MLRTEVSPGANSVGSYALDGSGKRAKVVPLGIGPTMNAWTDGPADTVANDAWAGTSSGIAMVCAPAGSSSSRMTREVLFGSGGTNEVCHQAMTVTSCGPSRDMPIDRDWASYVTEAAVPVVPPLRAAWTCSAISPGMPA